MTRGRKKPWVHAVVAFRYLTDTHKRLITERFGRELQMPFDEHSFKKHRGAMRMAKKLVSMNIIELNRGVYLRLIT